MMQGLPSLAAAHAVQARRGDRILDMCAAPGGKTTALAAHMEDVGEVIALDRSHQKVSHIKALAESFGLKAVLAVKRDATTVAMPSRQGPEGQKLGPKGGISVTQPSPKELARLERKRKGVRTRTRVLASPHSRPNPT